VRGVGRIVKITWEREREVSSLFLESKEEGTFSNISGRGEALSYDFGRKGLR